MVESRSAVRRLGHHSLAVPAEIRDGVAADLAHPAEQRRLAAVTRHLFECAAVSLLHHFADIVAVAVEPQHRKTVQLREQLVEQPAKSRLVARQDARGQGLVVLCRIDWAIVIDLDAAVGKILRGGARRICRAAGVSPRTHSRRQRCAQPLVVDVVDRNRRPRRRARIHRELPPEILPLHAQEGNTYFPLKPGRQLYYNNSRCVAEGECEELEELWITTEFDTRRITLGSGAQSPARDHAGGRRTRDRRWRSQGDLAQLRRRVRARPATSTTSVKRSTSTRKAKSSATTGHGSRAGTARCRASSCRTRHSC